MAKKILTFNKWNKIMPLGKNITEPEAGGLYCTMKMQKRKDTNSFGVYGILKLKEGSTTDIEESYNLTLPNQWAKGGKLALEKKRVILFSPTPEDESHYKAHRGSMANKAVAEKIKELTAELEFEKATADDLMKKNHKQYVEITNLYSTLHLIPRFIRRIFAV